MTISEELDDAITDMGLGADEPRLKWITRNLLEEKRRVVRYVYAFMDSRCDTGIEASMCIALIDNFLNYKELTIDEVLAAIKPRYQLDWCKLDFLVILNGCRYDIECDGEPWHTNKARDARRDAFVRSQGIVVHRFTGKEIHADPTACVLRVFP